jgi:hypothetical protein
MKKSMMRFLFGALLATISLAMSARAQSNVVYAVEFNQSNNRFGTIDLWNGNFNLITNIGGTLINDLAYCPTNGMLYGIVNSTTLVTFNEINGTMTSIGNFNAGIESLAFRPSDGVLFGATQTALYIIDPVTGNATFVGNFGTPTNLGSTGQNIRFAQDGNLYDSNTSANTDIYRINTANGVATWMGEASGIPDLMLMNEGNSMYGVYISLGSSSGPENILAAFDLTSFVEGGTNADGSTHQISIAMVGAGTNFPINFIFSSGAAQPVTNLTVPVSATGPTNQTVVAGNNVVFSTVASGTGPYNYAWLSNGVAISGQTGSSLTLNNVTTNEAAAYSVIVGGEVGTVTNSATLTVLLPPVANPVSYSRPPGAGVLIFVSTLLANDTDPNGYKLSYLSCDSQTANGVSLGIYGSGNSTLIVYPCTATNIADSFQYTISDGNGGTATGTVIITLVTTTGQQTAISVNGGMKAMSMAQLSVTLTFYGLPGYHYTVQRATSLSGPWANITVTSGDASIDNSQGYSVITAPAAGAFTVTDPSPPGSSGFYQLATAP